MTALASLILVCWATVACVQAQTKREIPPKSVEREKVCLSEILTGVPQLSDPIQVNEARDKADEIHTALLAGAKFEEMAKKYSSGPSTASSATLDVSPNPQLDLSPWAKARPYLDDDLPKLFASVPELKGLDAASSQEQLTYILDHAGEKCVDLLRRVPNIIAREEVVSVLPKAPRAGFSMTPHVGIERENFDYLLLSEQTPSGTALREYRMVDGRPATAPLGMGQLSEGFTSEWLHLHPANQSQARFRYLGREMMDKHQTFVVGFAQIPQMVSSPPTFQLSGNAVAIFVQGIVWVDSTDFRIVRMREDLLAPRPDVGLKKFTTTIRFGEVNIAKAASSLWLPQEVVIDWEFQGETVQRRHRYSKYRLYGATTKILPAAP